MDSEKPETDQPPKEKEDFLSKEESMFKIDSKGEAIPEEYKIFLYDQNIDREQQEETLMLVDLLNKQQSTEKIIAEELKNQRDEISSLEKQLKTETKEKIKLKLEFEIVEKENVLNAADIKTRLNFYNIQGHIDISRDIIKQLEEKKSLAEEKKILIIPCTITEAKLSFEEGRTIKGEETSDWVASLISEKVFKPKYTFEEAQRLRPAYKEAMKKAIAAVSNYKTVSHRELLMRLRTADSNPLLKKKELPTKESLTPEKSA